MCQFVRGDVVAVASVEPRNRCLELLYRCGLAEVIRVEPLGGKTHHPSKSIVALMVGR